MQKRSRPRNRTISGNKVTIRFADGSTGAIDINTIPGECWKSFHGTASDGIKVNSMKAYTPPGSLTTILTHTNRRNGILTVPTRDIEVFAKQFIDTINTPQ